ncbi:MAG: DUF6993 domain-containing protein [Agromyces sp.]
MNRFRRIVDAPAVFLVTILFVLPVAAGVATYLSDSIAEKVGAASAPATPSATPSGSGEPDRSLSFVKNGSASRNMKFFDFVNSQTMKKYGNPVGQNFIDELELAGFPRDKMQLTWDTTAAGLQADSIQFSVQLDNGCLIGQWGAGSDGYHSIVARAIPGIGCLIGQTRPIDW